MINKNTNIKLQLMKQIKEPLRLKFYVLKDTKRFKKMLRFRSNRLSK